MSPVTPSTKSSRMAELTCDSSGRSSSLTLVANRDFELTPLAGHQRRIEVRRHRESVEGGRHHDELELGARRRAQPLEQRERKISLQVSLVKFIEHHRAHAAQRGIAHQAPRQDPFGQKLDPGRRRHASIEANLVAHGAPDLLAALFGHPLRRETRRKTTWLEHQHLARNAAVEKRRRHARRLPCPGGRLQHEHPAFVRRLEHPREHLVDGERRAGERGHDGRGFARHVGEARRATIGESAVILVIGFPLRAPMFILVGAARVESPRGDARPRWRPPGEEAAPASNYACNWDPRMALCAPPGSGGDPVHRPRA